MDKFGLGMESNARPLVATGRRPRPEPCWVLAPLMLAKWQLALGRIDPGGAQEAGAAVRAGCSKSRQP